MTILAAIEGNLIFIVIMAVIGVINWLTKKDENPVTKADKEEAPVRPARENSPRASTPEEERVRRFMEALGVPVEGPPPVPSQRRPAPIKAEPLPRIQPGGTITAGGSL